MEIGAQENSVPK